MVRICECAGCNVLRFVGAIACVVAITACTSSPPVETGVTPAIDAAAAETVVPSSLEITYVDNTSFLIVSGGKKVLVDAHSMLSREVRASIEQAVPPFDGIDLILATHTHPDHFDPLLVGACLEQNPHAVFASTEEAVDELQRLLPTFGELQGRVRPFEPAEGERAEATLNGIDLEVLNLPHGVPLTNLGFVMDVGGRRLLHTGDMVRVSDLQAYGLQEEHIDVAFVPYLFLTEPEFLAEDSYGTILDAVQADHVVLMHYSFRQSGVERLLEELATRSPDSVLFHETMETWVVR